MGLNESKGNMYDFVTHTWNAIKGKCFHDCSYCYMKRHGKLNPIRLDEKELKTDLGKGNFIFVGSSTDMFAQDVPEKWIKRTLDYCKRFDNEYIFQTKNPRRIGFWKRGDFPEKTVFCITLETNRHYVDEMKCSPPPAEREHYFKEFLPAKYITIEPVMDFDLVPFISMIRQINPIQVNIGADSGNNNLPEPNAYKIEKLISHLERFTIVNRKKNLSRICD